MPLLGQTIFNTDTQVLETYDGVAWRSSLSVGMWKVPCRLATAAALPAYTRTVNVLNANANGALANIDGVAAAVGNRILLKNGAAGADNGIYVVNSLGDATHTWQMTRAEDADESAELRGGVVIAVSEGTVNGLGAPGAGLYTLSTNDPITLNTTALSFVGYRAVSFADSTNTYGVPGGGSAQTTLRTDAVLTAPGTVMSVAGADETNSTTTAADVTGLTFATVAATKYWFRAVLAVTTAATTNAILLAANHSTAITTWRYISQTPIESPATGGNGVSSSNTLDTFPSWTTGPGATLGLATVEGRFQTNTAGTFAIRLKSSAAAAATVKLGSFLMIQPVQ